MNMTRTTRLGWLAAAPLVLLGCPGEPEAPPEPEAQAPPVTAAPATTAPSGRPYSEAREACRDRNALRNPYYGDFHVHTGLSMDAYTWETRATPDDALRFARGEPLRLAPLDEQGRGTRTLQLERPLDFAAITDHSEWLGEVSLCTRAGSPAYDSPACRTFRGESAPSASSGLGRLGDRMSGFGLIGQTGRSVHVCGADGAQCLAEAATVWKQIQEATERHYDRSAECRFTTFHAYEYSATPDLSKVHHNVFFRNAKVPALPISWLDQPSFWGLLDELQKQCLDADNGCDVVTAPHNSNLSNGRMFTIDYRDEPAEQQVARARRRADIERLVEISQIKGDSECRNGLYRVIGGTDEQCDYEKMWPGDTPPPDCEEGTGQGALAGQGCQSRLDFVRYTLIEGLREAERIGVNPYKLGVIASTDTHNANPGDVEETSYEGWTGIDDDEPAERLGGGNRVVGGGGANPGGLVGAWAEENSRDALFDAFKRRETFGTSGPRIAARLFGGWDYAAQLCADPALLDKAYAGGVPMGADLPERSPDAAAPVFVAWAQRDPGTATLQTHPLQRIQVIKGWMGQDGQMHQAVYDVAGSPGAGLAVDTQTCAPSSQGHASLCAVWRDPDFDPTRRAVYYARVLETPSCRWSTLQCNALPPEQQPPACSDARVPRTVQERAWTSPIWYEPAAADQPARPAEPAAGAQTAPRASGTAESAS
jgi:hypothetical protein